MAISVHLVLNLASSLHFFEMEVEITDLCMRCTQLFLLKNSQSLTKKYIRQPEAAYTTKNPEISDDSIPSRTSSKTSLGFIRDGLRDGKNHWSTVTNDSAMDLLPPKCHGICATFSQSSRANGRPGIRPNKARRFFPSRPLTRGR